jgi:hypothetical protein
VVKESQVSSSAQTVRVSQALKNAQVNDDYFQIQKLMIDIVRGTTSLFRLGLTYLYRKFGLMYIARRIAKRYTLMYHRVYNRYLVEINTREDEPTLISHIAGTLAKRCTLMHETRFSPVR